MFQCVAFRSWSLFHETAPRSPQGDHYCAATRDHLPKSRKSEVAAVSPPWPAPSIPPNNTRLVGNQVKTGLLVNKSDPELDNCLNVTELTRYLAKPYLFCFVLLLRRSGTFLACPLYMCCSLHQRGSILKFLALIQFPSGSPDAGGSSRGGRTKLGQVQSPALLQRWQQRSVPSSGG